MATPIAKLNKEGQLVSTTTTEPPITVNSSVVVTKLNADMVDGLNSTSFLRTDADSSLSSSKKLTLNGTTEVSTAATLDIKEGAVFKLGFFTLSSAGSIISFKYNPAN